MDILNMEARGQSAALERRDLSALELMEATLARIEAVNPAINAVVSLRDGDTLRAEARAADEGPRKGWLHGMPIAIKDLANAAGLPTSQGSPLFAGQVAARDDIMVARLRAAGAIVIGKTNTPEFGLGSHTVNPVHGATRNPYDTACSAGGSSGGAAAALATGMLAVADGSDMMGSLRNPAGWNNVYGMRPTWGTVPGDAEGDLFLHPLSTLGPMARSPADMAALLDTMTGADPALPLSTDGGSARAAMETPPGALRIGWLGDWGGAFPYEPGIAEICEGALRQMADMGHRIDAPGPPFDADLMWRAWCDLRALAVAAKLRGLHADEAKRAHLKPAALWEVECGLALDARRILEASARRSDWFRSAQALFQGFDVLALPSAQVWPFDVTWTAPERIGAREMDTYHRWMQVVVPASLIGLPVVNVPVGFGRNGLPAGMQLIGPRGSDGALLRLAQQWHDGTGWPQARPPQM
ncbi:amidase [Roseovarius aquimarinus]|uniref:Amidase n=1 Tax=Roseovarius aquimarinus TaxID=1229156 RepID=A0ABW7I898_9RHOB